MRHKVTHREFLFISPYHTYSKRTFLYHIIEKRRKNHDKVCTIKIK